MRVDLGLPCLHMPEDNYSHGATQLVMSSMIMPNRIVHKTMFLTLKVLNSNMS